MVKKNASDRELRLECLKIAANVVAQLKDSKVSVVETAMAFYKFVDSEALDEAGNDAGSNRGVSRVNDPAHQRPYTLKDLRRKQ